MEFFVTGLSYKTAPVELRERMAVSASQLRCGGCRLRVSAGLAEVVILSTCNRVEVYGVRARPRADLDGLFRHLSAAGDGCRPHLYLKVGATAVRHLFSVASGLDSMVLGETEITGQVKQAYQVAQEAKLTGRITNRLFQRALQTAKAIRTQTEIGRGATSVGSVAVELAEKIFGREMSQKSIMIIGAGKMGEACVRHLAKKGVRSVLVSNRSFDRAQDLAAEFGGSAVRFDDCLRAMVQADIVVSSTGCPRTILHRGEMAGVMRERRNRPLVLIDIAVPRDIDADVESLDNVYLYNIDHLEAIVRENVRHREQELAKCQGILEEATMDAMTRLEVQGRPDSSAWPVSRPAWEWSGAVAVGA